MSTSLSVPYPAAVSADPRIADEVRLYDPGVADIALVVDVWRDGARLAVLPLDAVTASSFLWAVKRELHALNEKGGQS